MNNVFLLFNPVYDMDTCIFKVNPTLTPDPGRRLSFWGEHRPFGWGLAHCGTVFPWSVVVGTAMPAVCRWGPCPRCPSERRSLGVRVNPRACLRQRRACLRQRRACLRWRRACLR